MKPSSDDVVANAKATPPNLAAAGVNPLRLHPGSRLGQFPPAATGVTNHPITRTMETLAGDSSVPATVWWERPAMIPSPLNEYF